jgi:ABC-2 type transport system permease protein
VNGELASEMLKARTTRTTISVLAAMLGVVMLATALHALGLPTDKLSSGSEQRQVFVDIGSNMGMLFAALAGTMALTGEIRHGTIRPTLLATPQRSRVVAAKALVSLVTGSVIGALAGGVVAGAGTLLLRARGIDVEIARADYFQLVAGGAVAAALWSIIGLGVGGIVRSQVPSIVALFVWVLFVENILFASFPRIGRFSPGALGRTIAGQTSGTLDSAAPAALLLAGYALAAIAAGTITTTRRDVA